MYFTRSSSLRSGVFTAIGGLLAITAGVFVVLILSIGAVRNDERLVNQTDEVRHAAAVSERAFEELESGLQAFLLTGQRRFLAPYTDALAPLADDLRRLETLTRGDRKQNESARAIAGAVSSYESSFALPLAASSGRFTHSENVQIILKGERLANAIRGRLSQLPAAEALRTERSRADAASSARTSLIAAAGGFALLVLLLGALTAYLSRAVLTPIRRVAEAAVRVGQGRIDTWVPGTERGELGALVRAFNSMSSTLSERELSLRVTDERFKGILENANAAIYVKDSDSRYMLVNREFERVRGLTAAEVIGHTEDEIGSRVTAAQIRASDRAVIESGVAMSFEQEIDTREGRRTYLSLKFPVHTEDGSVTSIAGISTDLTGQTEILAKAVEASRLKSEFVANMSHEIRTPLNGVIGMTNLLNETSLDPVQREYADALVASSAALLTIITDILDFSKIEAGHLELDPTDFGLRGAVDEACQMLAEQAHAQGLEIRHTVDADLPMTVNGDRGRLRQILLNLLSNAIKFTPSGEILVHVSSDGDPMVRFEVSDTGVGIKAGDAARLFEPFVQGDQSTTRLFGGTGIGLTIARELAHHMGGSIGAEPRAGAGSTFWFTAKLPPVASEEAPFRARPDLQGLRALVVDTYETNRTIFEHYLSAWGLASESLEGPQEAIETLEHAARGGVPFQLVLIDLDLPQANGLELVHAIRGRPVLRALHILLIGSNPPQRIALPDLGVSAILRKPVRRSELYNAIAEAIVDLPAHREPSLEKPESADWPLVLVAEDNRINDAVATAMLGKQGVRTVIAHNGREAVEMALSHDYAAILMDCQMPELDGYEATRMIRDAERGRHVPIIAMTAHSMTGDRERCLAAGMDDYLSKPIRADELATVMSQQLSERRPGRDRRDPRGSKASEPESRPGDAEQPLDEAVIGELRDALTAETRESLIQTFEVSLPKCVADIESAISGGDENELRRAAHLLKGSSASLGAMRLTLCCQQFEQSSRSHDPALDAEHLAELHAAADEARVALRKQLT